MSEVDSERDVEEVLDELFHDDKKIDPRKLNLKDELLWLNRVAKVVKGGRRFSFSALVAVGDGNGHVGLGFGKANEVPDAISKATDRAKKNLIRVPMMGRTIPHQIVGEHDSARVLMKPASEGTGLVCASAIRLYLGLAGVHDILAKSLGSGNLINVLKAVQSGLVNLKRADEVARLRGKKVEELIGQKRAKLYLDTKLHIMSATNPELTQQVRSQVEARKQEAEREAATASSAEAAAAAETSQPELAESVPPPDATTPGTEENKGE